MCVAACWASFTTTARGLNDSAQILRTLPAVPNTGIFPERWQSWQGPIYLTGALRKEISVKLWEISTTCIYLDA